MTFHKLGVLSGARLHCLWRREYTFGLSANANELFKLIRFQKSFDSNYVKCRRVATE